MAGIDKIYGDQSQYWELWTFCYERRPSLLRYFRASHLTDKQPHEERTICNLPVRADVWLWDNCPFEWVRERLIQQYDGPPYFSHPEKPFSRPRQDTRHWAETRRAERLADRKAKRRRVI